MPNQESKISPGAQYKEEYESWRQHDRFIWQTPSIIVALDAAAIVASWAVTAIPWWVREFIIAFALILTVVLTFALIKHRYFIDLEQKTLLALEEKYAQRCIQRMSKPRKGTAYWAQKHDSTPFEKFSAHRLFKWGMYGICFLLLALLVLNGLKSNPCISPYIVGFSWVLYAALVAVAIWFLCKNHAF